VTGKPPISKEERKNIVVKKEEKKQELALRISESPGNIVRKENSTQDQRRLSRV